MALMNDWFLAWLDRHMDRHPRDDWPRVTDEGGRNFYAGWRGNMIMKGVREEEAEAASIALMGKPPERYGDHPAAIIRIVEDLWKDMRSRGEANPVDARDAAALASKDCGDCHGDGLTVRWRVKSAKTCKTPEKPYIICYCLCPYGRWMEHAHARTAPDVRKRIYDLKDHPWLMDEKYRSDPRSRAEDVA